MMFKKIALDKLQTISVFLLPYHSLSLSPPLLLFPSLFFFSPLLSFHPHFSDLEQSSFEHLSFPSLYIPLPLPPL